MLKTRWLRKSLVVSAAVAVMSLTGCSAISDYHDWKATPEKVLERQKVETANLEAYHTAERHVYGTQQNVKVTAAVAAVAVADSVKAKVDYKKAQSNAVIVVPTK